MTDIRSLYTVAARLPTNGVEGYHLEHKYFDVHRSRQEKGLATSRQRTKPLNISPKRSFLDDVCQREKKLPGPTSYEPYKQLKKNLSKELKSQSPPKLSFIDELQKQQKKWNFPAAGKYDKIELEARKDKSRSAMSKAQISNYLDTSMRKSIEYPGVGSYVVKEKSSDKGVPKWKAPTDPSKNRSQSHRGFKIPEPGTYNPLPSSYDLFDSMASSNKKSQRARFGRQERFRSDKSKAVPFYNIGSDWGMRNKLNKKDILSRVGSSVTHHSIYY